MLNTSEFNKGKLAHFAVSFVGVLNIVSVNM